MHYRGPLPGEGRRQSPHAGQGQGQGQDQGPARGRVQAPGHPVRAVTSAMYQFSHLEMGIVTAPASQGCWADSERRVCNTWAPRAGTHLGRVSHVSAAA